MDVERIQKINTLAVDLMRQGLATDREDAVMQAERVFRAKDSETYQSIRDTLQQSKKDVALNTMSSDSGTQDLSPESVRSVLEKNTQFIVKKLKDFEDRVESLEREVKELRLKLTYERLPTAREISTPRESAPAAMPSTSSSSSHPRSGNYRDQDVSIEKFFYMGAK